MKTTKLLRNLSEGEPSITVVYKKQLLTPFIAFALLTILISSQFAIAAPVTSAWSCGAWTKDKNNSCVEIQTCTRSICDTKGKVTNCRNETKTSKSTDPDCTPAPTKAKARTQGKASNILGGVQKIKQPSPATPVPIPYPVINKRFDEADAMFGKRTNKGISGAPINLASTQRLRLTNGKSLLQPSIGTLNYIEMNGIISTTYTNASLFKDTNKNIWVNANGTKTKLGVFSRIETQRFQPPITNPGKMKLPK